MSRMILFHEERCTNCHLCEMYCSLVLGQPGIIELWGPLREFCRTTPSARGEEVDLPTGATVADLLARCGIPPDKVHHLLGNRHRATLDTVLADGGQVWAVPLAAGG